METPNQQMEFDVKISFLPFGTANFSTNTEVLEFEEELKFSSEDVYFPRDAFLGHIFSLNLDNY